MSKAKNRKKNQAYNDDLAHIQNINYVKPTDTITSEKYLENKVFSVHLIEN